MRLKTSPAIEEALIAIGLLGAAIYLYYVIALWGLADRFQPGVFRDYVTGAGVQVEMFVVWVGFGVAVVATNAWLESPRLRERPFGQIILIRSGVYLAAFLVVSGAVHVILGLFVLSEADHMALMTTLSGRFVVSASSSLVLSVVGVNFLLEVRRKVGPGNLIALLTGRYHRPKDEERLFLFLDLKDSTAIAESLGHNVYSQFLRSCFQDLTAFVLRYGAQIYQYVGDEVVLTWASTKPHSRENCLQTFFAFQNELERKSHWYRSKFGLAPEFRAGVDMGTVTVAEVGDVKREIAYHGDPLNTAARLLELCKQFGRSILITGEFEKAISRSPDFLTEWQGELTLRGKSEDVAIYGVSLQVAPSA